MKIDIRQMGSVTVVTPQAAVAQDDVDDFARTVSEQRTQTQGRLILDFAHVAFLDSRGVEALWDFSDEQRATGRAAKVAAVGELSREILELTGVAEHLELFDTAESAVRSFG